ncbi:BrxA family protein, partial [Enterococcus faecium]
MNKKYSAGLVSKRFWFSEFKLYIQLRLEGYTDIEIKEKNEHENIFFAVSSNRQKEIYQNVKRRVSQLDEAGLQLFNQLNIDNQK